MKISRKISTRQWLLFWGSLFPYDFDMDYQEFNLQGFREEVGDEIFNALYPCALEFFFSNEYPHKDTREVWNIIDLFLKKRGTPNLK